MLALYDRDMHADLCEIVSALVALRLLHSKLRRRQSTANQVQQAGHCRVKTVGKQLTF
jgi:hypothetical protein